MKRLVRWTTAAVGAVLLLAASGLLLDRLFPPDLSRLSDLSVLVEDKDGGLLRAFTAKDGSWRLPVTVEAVDPRFRRMLLAYEDKRFESHWGVDPLAVARAFGQLLAHGHVVSGASTLTMQTARLLEPRPRTFGAKLIEMARAFQLEARFGKDRILAMYLTLAPYGGNLSGIRAASRFYFGKEPKELSDGEAALLVALPQSPERLRPDRAPVAASAARVRVLARLQAARGNGRRARLGYGDRIQHARRLEPGQHARTRRRCGERRTVGPEALRRLGQRHQQSRLAIAELPRLLAEVEA